MFRLLPLKKFRKSVLRLVNSQNKELLRILEELQHKPEQLDDSLCREQELSVSLENQVRARTNELLYARDDALQASNLKSRLSLRCRLQIPGSVLPSRIKLRFFNFLLKLVETANLVEQVLGCLSLKVMSPCLVAKLIVLANQIVVRLSCLPFPFNASEVQHARSNNFVN